MKGKNTVLTVGILVACAGTAFAQNATPAMAKIKNAPQKVEIATVTPEYFIDGVWVQGQTVPYHANTSRDVPGRIIVWDGGYAADDGAGNWAPGNDPCSGYGYLFTATTDTSAANYFTVNNSLMINDFDNLEAHAVGKGLSGFFWTWHQATEIAALGMRLRWYDVCNTANSSTFTGAGGFYAQFGQANILGNGRMGVSFTFNPPNIPAGDWYTNFDVQDFFADGAILDLNGGFGMVANTNGTTQSIRATDLQMALQGVNGTVGHPGSSNAIAWIDDSGELGRVSSSHAYNLAAAVGNGAIQNTGTAATGNETYTLTDPACFTSGLGIASSWWVRGCTAAEAGTNLSPANGATGVTNPVTCSFSPPAVLPIDFNLNIKLNNNNQPQSTLHQFVADIPVTGNLDDGRAYGWSITSYAGADCPGADSETWTFRMAGCAADFNLDTVVDFFDYLDFVDALSANGDLADYNADQVVDFIDYLDFVDALSTGC